MKNIVFYLSIIIIAIGCVEPINQAYTKLPPGIWRGELHLDNTPRVYSVEDEYVVDDYTENELPFTFEVIYTSEDSFYIEFINGEERLRSEKIVYGRDKETAKDTVIIDFPTFDTYIKAIYEDDVMEGDYYVNYRKNYKVPFKAFHGQSHRFTTLKQNPVTDISGKWEVKFEVGTEDEYPAIGEFKQDGNHLLGTFMTETGDYRFLEGTIQENKLFLSTFDAAHAFLFSGKILEDGSITGLFKSGKHYTTSWEARRNEDANLKNAFDLTKNQMDTPINIAFPNTDGDTISLTDQKFQGKIKLVKITGTWCPNCKDETDFLVEYLAKNQSDEVEVIEVAFERYAEDEKNLQILKRYEQNNNLPFTILYGGQASKTLATEKFPMLDKIISFPTLLFVDKANIVRKVHTGFAGPATSGYQDFKAEFEATINELKNQREI